MKHLAITVFFIVFLLCSVSAHSDYMQAGSDSCGGINNLLLIYNGDRAERSWTGDELRHYVFHMDHSGAADDWFFDGFLIMGFLLPGGTVSQTSTRQPQADKDGWQWFIDRLFSEDGVLHTLDATIDAAPDNLPPAEKRKIVIMVPYPSPVNTDFGDLDGDGNTDSLQKDRQRYAAVKWYVDTAMQKWSAAGYEHLQLSGFYWMEEAFYWYDVKLINRVGDMLRSRGQRLFWIPYYTAPDRPGWKDAGFDCVAKQPNYFFSKWHAEDDRVERTADLARANDMGIEIEVDGSVITNRPQQYDKYLKYLDAAASKDMMGRAYFAWYQSVKTLLTLYESDDPELQCLYHATYKFVKGQYIPGATCR